MSIQMHTMETLHESPFFNLLLESFPEHSQFLLEADADTLVSGADPSYLLGHDPSVDFDGYFVRNLFKKVENLDIGVDPIDVALNDFTSFLKDQDDKEVFVRSVLEHTDPSSELGRVISWIQRFYTKVFNDFREHNIVPRHSTGATIGLPRGSSPVARTLQSEGHRHLSSIEFEYKPGDPRTRTKLFSAMYNMPHTEGTDDFYVEISVVGKNAKIGRVVGKHPSSIMAMQNGFGDYLTEKLSRYCGIDLPTAQTHHQQLAMENSLTDVFATQDQKNASNNILHVLCKHFLPAHVMSFLDFITPRVLKIGDDMHHVNMMCPAGNGYIFPFQTMLFWAIVKAVQHVKGVSHDVWVYGDDVILHGDIYDSVNRVYEAFGLEVNQEKSFKTGPFRESCGGDFLYGNNVRPFYVHNIPNTTIEWIRVINGIRRVGYYNNANVWRSTNLRYLWLRCCKFIQQKDRLFAPRHYGDSAINTERSSAYRFAEPTLRAADGVKYSGTPREDGLHYGQERIYIYVPYSATDGRTFEQESRGLRADDLLRLVSLGSLSYTGGNMKTFTLRENPKNPRQITGREQRWVYPKAFGRLHEAYRIQKIPYTLTGQAPDNVEELFSFLLERGTGGIIHSSSLIMQKHDEKRATVMGDLIATLRQIALQRQAIVERAKSTVQLFTL